MPRGVAVAVAASPVDIVAIIPHLMDFCGSSLFVLSFSFSPLFVLKVKFYYPSIEKNLNAPDWIKLYCVFYGTAHTHINANSTNSRLIIKYYRLEVYLTIRL